MQILALVATGVRNLRPLQLEPRERFFNVFSGDTRQGKTNPMAKGRAGPMFHVK